MAEVDFEQLGAFFDNYVLLHSFDGYPVEHDAMTEDRKHARAAYDSTMLAATEVGVYIGDNAHANRLDIAQQKAEAHELIDPLFHEAPYSLQVPGATEFIPRKLGETRGLFFARTVAEVGRRDAERAKELEDGLVVQLLLRHERIEHKGITVTDPDFQDKRDTENELGLLERIASSPDSTDLDAAAIASLKSMIEKARIYLDAAKNTALYFNLEALQSNLDFHKTYYRRNRIIRRAGAVACGVVAVFSLGVMSKLVRPTEASGEAKSVANEVADTIQGGLSLDHMLDPTGSEDIQRELTDITEAYVHQQEKGANISDDDQEVFDRLQKFVDTYAGMERTSSGRLDKDAVHDLQDEIERFRLDLQRGEFAGLMGYVLIATLVTAYGGFAIGLLRSASKKGGRLDPLHKKLDEVEAGGPMPWDIGPANMAAASYNRANGLDARHNLKTRS